MKKLLPVLLPLIAVILPAHGQSHLQDYYINNSALETTDISSDTEYELFYRPIAGSGTIFGNISEFSFNAVRYNDRGYSPSFRAYMFGSSEISDLFSGNPDYGLVGVLGRSAIRKIRYAGLDGRAIGNVSGQDRYITDVREMMPHGTSVSASAYDRRGRWGLKASSAGSVSENSAYAVWLSRRWGRDAHITGVFNDETSLTANYGLFLGAHSLSLHFAGVYSEGGLRSYAVKETFRLTDDNHYNPSWGYDGGKVRNSRVATNFIPFAAVNYSFDIDGRTIIDAMLSVRSGKRRNSYLGWINAENPYPDYYRYLPDYLQDDHTEQAWRDRKKSVTQVDWNSMREVNAISEDGSRYFIENRVEHPLDIQFNVGGTTELNKTMMVSYGVNYRNQDTHYYKEVRSLLGGGRFADIDNYLSGEDEYGNIVHNNMSDPDRLVGKGDRFGYDYHIKGSRVAVHGGLGYFDKGYDLRLKAQFGQNVMSRRGVYEKEVFPGRMSKGRSKEIKTSVYDISVQLSRSVLGGRHLIRVNAAASSYAPYAGAVFISPDYNNKTINNPRPVKVLAAEVLYALNLDRFTTEVNGYVTTTKGESAVYRFWEDVNSVYSDMTLSGIDKIWYGVEVAASYRISNSFTATVAGAVGDHKYRSDPRVNIYADETGEIYVRNSTTYLKNYKLGNSPQRVATGELRYSSWGWIASAKVNYMGGRYIAPTPLRRMPYVFNNAGSAEKVKEFTRQGMLPDVWTLDLFFLKSFNFKRSVLTAVLSVNNILDDKDIIYNGYEQMRVLKRGSGINTQLVPFANKYLYGYGRTYYFSITYRF